MTDSALGQSPASPLSLRKEEKVFIDSHPSQRGTMNSTVKNASSSFSSPCASFGGMMGKGKEEECEDSSCNMTLWVELRESDPEVNGVGWMTWPNNAVICDCKAINPALRFTSMAE